MRIGFIKEIAPFEARTSISPEIIKKFTKQNIAVVFEPGTGTKAFLTDEALIAAGAKPLDRSAVLQSDVVCAVQRPLLEDVTKMKPQAVLLGCLVPYEQQDFFTHCAKQNIYVGSLELIPRISRAQSMDVLSSQANIVGYRAVLEAACHYRRFFPMMMTSAGSAKAVQVVVLGAGVAGLQAIATARRLGAQVQAYDVRPEVKEQVESLGAKWISLAAAAAGVGEGGYAKELTLEEKQQQQKALQDVLAKADVVIATASIPGRKAPLLITKHTVSLMRAGSVIVDLAANTGGNCEVTQANEVVQKDNVTIVGHTQYASSVATDASLFYAKNIFAFLQLLIKYDQGVATFHWDWNDEIVVKTFLVADGKVRKG